MAEGRIHCFIAGGRMGGSGAASAITSRVESTCTAETVGTATVYDLS